MAIGLFLLFAQPGTLNIQDMLHAAEMQWSVVQASRRGVPSAAGRRGWQISATPAPDMAARRNGRTHANKRPYSCGDHGDGRCISYSRTHPLFEMAPSVQLLVALIGLITLLLSGFTAMTQSDIKRILAYSTVSQIGYMFLGLGVGAWSAAIFHLMTHAFFKALLFLASGTVILSLHHEQNIFKMGVAQSAAGFLFSFLIGSLALTAFPYTSGYFSKDEILLGGGSRVLVLAGRRGWSILYRNLYVPSVLHCLLRRQSVRTPARERNGGGTWMVP